MVYLCLANRLQWQPIGYTFFKKGEARFEDVGGGAVFTLGCLNGKEYAAVSSPFFWSVKPERYGSLFRKLKSRNWSCIGSAILL